VYHPCFFTFILRGRGGGGVGLFLETKELDLGSEGGWRTWVGVSFFVWLPSINYCSLLMLATSLHSGDVIRLFVAKAALIPGATYP